MNMILHFESYLNLLCIDNNGLVMVITVCKLTECVFFTHMFYQKC